MSSAATPLAILAWLGTAVLHGTLLMVAALALGRRVRALWLREHILRTAFFGGLLTATLSTIGYEPLLGRFALTPPPSPVREGAARAPEVASRPATPQLLAEEASLALRPLELEVVELAERIEPAWRELEPASLSAALRARTPLDLASAAWLVLGAWGLWCALAWGRTVHGLLRLQRSLRDRTPLEGPIAADLTALRRRARVQGRVRLSVSERTSVPVTLGLFRREICLPRRALAAFTRAELRAILAHELAHTRRRDTLWFLAYALVEPAFAFHPLQRRVRRELLNIAELDCDDLAVGWTGAGLELASSLTEIARWLVASGDQRLPVPTMAHDRSRLSRRVMRLLEEQATRQRRERRALAGAGGLVVLGGVCALAPALGAAARIDAEPRSPEPPRLALPAETIEPRTAEPASEPAPDEPGPAAEAPPSGAPYALQLDQELFESELEMLDGELGELRTEVERLEQPRLAEAMADIERRMESLSLRRQRMNELLERVFEEQPPDVGGAPRADVPPESP